MAFDSIDEFILYQIPNNASELELDLQLQNIQDDEIFNNLRDVTFGTDVFDDLSLNSTDSSTEFILSQTSVNPVYTLSNQNDDRESCEVEANDTKTVLCGNSIDGKIHIISHPRSKFRPRTKKESEESSHYIRCEDDAPSEYPTIAVPSEWLQQENWIEVALVGIDEKAHPYIIENKERKASNFICKRDQPNVLYFYITNEDFMNGRKSFHIEYIKVKQNSSITKELIKTRQLHQSKLCFTRYCNIGNECWQRDENSVAYSTVMTEHYGDFTVEDIFPLYGPMRRTNKVCIELKGRFEQKALNAFKIIITNSQLELLHQVQNIKKRGSTITFYMPTLSCENINYAQVHITLQYKQDIIHQSNYVYIADIDKFYETNQEPSNFGTVAASSSSSAYNRMLDTVPRRSSTMSASGTRSLKRLRH